MPLPIPAAAALLLLVQSVETPVDPAKDPSPALAEALANRARIVTVPVSKTGPMPEFPQAARDAGAFGRSEVSGVVTPDGRLTEVRIVVSTRSALLDKAAVEAAAATLFAPARDAQGVAISGAVLMDWTFSNAVPVPGRGDGVLHYGCGQFARDYDWWFRTWPADKRDEFYVKLFVDATLRRERAGKVDYRDFGKGRPAFERRWKAAVEACRAAPEKLFVDIFQPEGDGLRQDAEAWLAHAPPCFRAEPVPAQPCAAKRREAEPGAAAAP